MVCRIEKRKRRFIVEKLVPNIFSLGIYLEGRGGDAMVDRGNTRKKRIFGTFNPPFPYPLPPPSSHISKWEGGWDFLSITLGVAMHFQGHAKTVPLFFRVASICNLLDATLNGWKIRWATLFRFSPFHRIMSPPIFARFWPFFEYKKNRRLLNVSHFYCYLPTAE